MAVKRKRRPWPLLALGAGCWVLALVILVPREWAAAARWAALGQGARSAVAIDPEAPVARDAGRLVHAAGTAVAAGPLEDPDFPVEVRALRLDREVEMLQWQERLEGTGADRTIFYDRVWSPQLIDSRRFIDALGHPNPGRLPVGPTTLYAREARLGRLVLDAAVLAGLAPGEPIAGRPGEALFLDGAPLTPALGWYFSGDPAAPDIGDVRLRFLAVPDGPLTVVAMQTADGRLEPWPSPEGPLLALARPGLHEPGALLGAAQWQGWRESWQLRLGMLMLAFVGGVMLLVGSGRRLETARLLGFAATAAVAVVALAMAFGWAVSVPLYAAGSALLLVVLAGLARRLAT
jgi:hypothetical protein